MGETSGNNGGGSTWKVTCTGDVVSSTFIPNDTGHNFEVVDGILYIAGSRNDLPLVRAYDVCTGNPVGTIELCDANDSYVWGFSYNPVTGLFYGSERDDQATGANGDGSIYIFSPDNLTNGQCVSTSFNAAHLAGTFGGITSDPQGNIYVAAREPAQIVKFDPNGNILASSGIDLSLIHI